MNDRLAQQARYWNAQADSFQRIYSHDKPPLLNLLDRVFRWDMYQRFEFAMWHAEPIKGRTFLDVGCGSGLYVVELAKRGAARVVGLDIAETMLRLSEQAAARAGVDDRCAFMRSDLLAYSSGERVDVTLGIGLFDYIADAGPVLRKMRDVTRTRVIASFPRLWTWRVPVRRARLGLAGCEVYFYTRGQIERLMRDAGFRDHAIERVGKLYCVRATV